MIALKVAPFAAALALIGFAAVDPLARAADPPVTVTVVQTQTVDRTYQGWDVRTWARHAVANRLEANQWRRNGEARGRTILRLRRELAHDPSVTEAVALARAIYGVDQTGRVRCESHGKPGAKNKHSDAAGLLQFMPGTWASTPFRSFSVYSPYAAALAGGWMVAQGRSKEWVCGL